jgi:SAM-dependent methyltransferase
MATVSTSGMRDHHDGRGRASIFSQYSNAEAKAYQQGRSSYPPALYETILSHHRSTGGEFKVLLDVGCGTGKATRDLAAFFDAANGCDESIDMINVAREVGGMAASEPIRYHVAAAEKLDSLNAVSPGSVDLITAAMAAQWFDMQLFWQQAGRLSKPGGTVALWTLTSGYCHPSTHNAEEVQKILWELEHVTFKPFEPPALHIARKLYDSLPLPWTASPSIDVFPESKYVRLEWNRDGQVKPNAHFFSATPPYMISLEKFESALNTASMTKSWRDAHPELAGTDADCIKVAISRLSVALEGREEFEHGGGTVLLLFKRV